MEDPLDDGDLARVTRREGNTLVLDALALSPLEDLNRVALFVEQQAVEAVRGCATGPEALAGNLRAALEDLRAELAAVACRPVTLDAEMKTVEEVILLPKPDRGEDDLLAVVRT